MLLSKITPKDRKIECTVNSAYIYVHNVSNKSAESCSLHSMVEGRRIELAALKISGSSSSFFFFLLNYTHDNAVRA